jgi:hypothetical protein
MSIGTVRRRPSSVRQRPCGRRLRGNRVRRAKAPPRSTLWEALPRRPRRRRLGWRERASCACLVRVRGCPLRVAIAIRRAHQSASAVGLRAAATTGKWSQVARRPDVESGSPVRRSNPRARDAPETTEGRGFTVTARLVQPQPHGATASKKPFFSWRSERTKRVERLSSPRRSVGRRKRAKNAYCVRMVVEKRIL